MLLVTLIGCVSAPETGRKQFIVVPESQMRALGAQTFVQMKQQKPQVQNQRLVQDVTAIGRRIAKVADENYDWEFAVFRDDDMVNAFCLPGGKVGVYTGMLPVTETNAGLAAVMAHEVAHATLRHGAERMSQSLVSQLGLSLAALSLENNEYRNLIMAALGVGVQVGIALPYSRLQEEEADKVGLEYMAQAGYDPEAAVKLWQRMAQRSSGAPPEFLSTHPNPSSRVKYLRKLVPQMRAIYQSAEQVETRPLDYPER
jgi:predicted Zn-dependent protease